VFALAVYWHDPDGMPIAVCQVPGLHHMEVQRPIFIEPIITIKGVCMDPKKVYIITKWQPPNCIKNV